MSELVKKPAPEPAVPGASEDGEMPVGIGELFIISAPSGAGKTTLINRLMRGEMSSLAFSVSHTTRAPRGDEVNGVDYHFVSVEQFQELIAADGFLEWAQVHGNLYGTSVAEVSSHLAAGVDVLLDIDVQGGQRVMAEYGEAAGNPLGTRVHSIFVMPPSYRELEQRLLQRNQDQRDQIMQRLETSKWEMSRAEVYDYVIVNDDARFASGVLASIIQDKRHRGPRMADRIAGILADFCQDLAGQP